MTEDSGIYKKHGTDKRDQDTTGAFENLANTYYTSGYLAEAEPRQEALELPKDPRQEFHPDTGSFHEHSDWVRSVAFSPDGCCIISGSCEQTIRVWDAMTGHSGAYGKLGPDKLDQDSTGVFSHLLGMEHPDMVTVLADLAHTYCAVGQYIEAAKRHEEMLNLRKKILGIEHPETIAALSDLLLTYYVLGHYAEANLRVQALRPLSDNLRLTHCDIGKKVLLEKALRLQKEILGGHHPDTIVASYNLAEAYYLLKETEAPQLETVRQTEEPFGNECNATTTLMHTMTEVYESLKEKTEALALLDSAGPKQNSMATASHPVGAQPYFDPELVVTGNDASLTTTNNHAMGCFCAKVGFILPTISKMSLSYKSSASSVATHTPSVKVS